MSLLTNSIQSAIQKPASVLTDQIKSNLDSGNYPTGNDEYNPNYKPIQETLKIGTPESREGKTLITITLGGEDAPYAKAFEFGSGEHDELGSPEKYVIEPKKAPALAFEWNPIREPWGSRKFIGKTSSYPLPINYFPAGAYDTRLFNTSVMILATPADAIGLTPPDPFFRYRVESYAADSLISASAVHTYTAGTPGLDFSGGLSGAPVWPYLPNAAIPVMFDATVYDDERIDWGIDSASPQHSTWPDRDNLDQLLAEALSPLSRLLVQDRCLFIPVASHNYTNIE